MKSKARSAVVTGAVGGIGRAIVSLLSKQGWDVHGWDLKPGAAPGIRWTIVDVGDAPAVETAASSIPSLDLLVNAAGILERTPADELTPDSWRRVMAVNLDGTFHTCRFLHGALAADGGGLIVNIASTGAHRASSGRVHYATSKAGVLMLTQCLALEWAPQGIRAVAISPGFVDSPMTEPLFAGGDRTREQVARSIPLGRLVTPDDVAEAVGLLADGRLAMVTGSTVVLDGGYLLTRD